MAKNLFKLLLHATLACCLAMGVSTSGTSLKGGFESTFYGELTSPSSKASDSDSPDAWLQSPSLFSPIILWVILVIVALARFAPSSFFHLKPIRAPPIVH